MPSGGNDHFPRFSEKSTNQPCSPEFNLENGRVVATKTSDPTPVVFYIFIINILQYTFPQAKNPVFQFPKSRDRIFCVFLRLLILQSKSLRPLLTGEFVWRSLKTQMEMRKQWILSGAANGPIPPQNQPQKRKGRPEIRSAEKRTKKWSG